MSLLPSARNATSRLLFRDVLAVPWVLGVVEHCEADGAAVVGPGDSRDPLRDPHLVTDPPDEGAAVMAKYLGSAPKRRWARAPTNARKCRIEGVRVGASFVVSGESVAST